MSVPKRQIRVRRCSLHGGLVSGTEAGDQRTRGASAPLLSRHCGKKPLRNTRSVSRVLAPRFVRRMQTRDWQTTPGSAHACERPDWLKRLGFRDKMANVCSSTHRGALTHPNQNDDLVLLPQSRGDTSARGQQTRGAAQSAGRLAEVITQAGLVPDDAAATAALASMLAEDQHQLNSEVEVVEGAKITWTLFENSSACTWRRWKPGQR